MAKPWERDYNVVEPTPAAPTKKPWEQGLEEARPEPPLPDMPWAEVGGQAIENFPASAKQVGMDIYNAVTSPVETGQAVLDLGFGVIQLIAPNITQSVRDEQSINMAKAVGQALVDRYGSVEKAKRTFAQDPAGFLTDVGSIAGAGAALTPAKLGRTKGALGAVSQYTDPIGMGIGAANVASNVAGAVVPEVVGRLTGTGAEPIREGVRAGRAGQPQSQLFSDAMRGRVAGEKIVADAKTNLQRMRLERSQQYQQGMQSGVIKDPTILSFDAIDDAVMKGIDDTRFKGQIKSPEAYEKMIEVKQLVENWKRLDPAEYHTPIGLDALKQQIGDVLSSLNYGSNARRVVGNVYSTVKGDIVKQAPVYAQIMKGYSEATDLISEIEKSLSLGDKASVDTSLRKLSSIMRNNVNTNFGQREQLLRSMEGNPNYIVPQVAGMAMNSAMPRGIQGGILPATTTGVGAATDAGTAGAFMAASSPRLVGEASLKLGQAQRIADKMFPYVTDPKVRLSLYQAEQARQQQEQIR